MRVIKILFGFGIIFICLIALVTLVCNLWVIHSSKAYLYDSIDEMPNNEVALVLGTSPSAGNGYANQYFNDRIDAASKLFHQQKVAHFILSGDNRMKNYNEPREMRKALNKTAVPDSCMTLDFAGFRTLDSIVRSKKVFKQKKITIVSQKYHNHRAVFIARFHGIDAIAFNANEYSFNKKRNHQREVLARVKAVLDLYVLRKQPKFLGETIDIPITRTLSGPSH